LKKHDLAGTFLNLWSSLVNFFEFFTNKFLNFCTQISQFVLCRFFQTKGIQKSAAKLFFGPNLVMANLASIRKSTVKIQEMNEFSFFKSKSNSTISFQNPIQI